ncbi:MAG: MarR family transcriptional regulator [Peptostreptococcaceae bacterium]|jgi:DNA-binding MarR family transcriptional regulator|nr:MarR family transcriptional regulator [Peptostreptococcaceae bacterium]
MVELKHEILRKIGELTRTIHAIVEPKFKEYGLKRGQFLYISRICENEGINQNELSNLLKVDKTRSAKTIKKLIEEDFITKIRDENDARAFLLYPNKKGKEIYKKVIAEENRQIDICFEGFQENDKKIILSLISKMTENIEKDWNKLKS